MRRTLAAVVLGPSLLLASLAWSSFGLLNTMLNPERSEKVATVLLDDPLVQTQLRQTLAQAVGDRLPEVVPISDETLETGAGVALANPAVELLIRDGFVQAHQAFLGEGEVPTEIDLGAAANEIRATTLGGVPGAEVLVPEDQLTIDLPTSNIPNLGGFRRWLARAAPLLAIMAAAGVGIAVLTTTDRPSVMRRAGRWALGSSAIWLVLNVAIPWAANEWFSGQAAVAASLIDAMFGEMLRPALVLAGLGVALLVGSVALPERSRERSDARSDARSDGGVVMRRTTTPDPGGLTPLYQAPVRPQRTNPGLDPLPPVDPQPRPVTAPAARPSPPPQPHARPAPPPAPAAAAQPQSAPVEQAWIPGVGYVDVGNVDVGNVDVGSVDQGSVDQAASTPIRPEAPPAPAPPAPAPPSAPVEQVWVPGVGYVDPPAETADDPTAPS